MSAIDNTKTIDHETFCRQTWAISHIFFLLVTRELLSLVYGQIDASSIFPWVLFISAMTILWSNSTLSFITMLLAQISFAIYSLPDLQNHRYLALFVNIGLLLSYNNKQFFNQKAIWIISRSLIVVYFFAAFHKVNSDFLNPTTSCATQFTKNIELLLPFIRYTILDFGSIQIYGTIILEFILPVLLLFKRTWKYAAILAVLFHLSLTYDFIKLFINFSGIMIGLVTIITAKKSISSFYANPKIIRLLLLITTFSILSPKYFGFEHFWHIFIVLTVFMFFSIRSIVSILNKSSAHNEDNLETSRSLIGCLLVGLLFINAASPYLNLKNRGAFNMYSNLQISNSYSNHLLIPRSIDLLQLGEDIPTGLTAKFLPKVPIDPLVHNVCSW